MTKHLKMARASERELQELLDFETAMEELDCADEYDLGEWLIKYLQTNDGWPFSISRVVWGYKTMFENACDPAASAIEWKPEIKMKLSLEITPQLLDMISNCCDGAQHGWDTYADDAIEIRKWVIKTRELLRQTAV